MKITRTRLILAGIIGTLVTVAAIALALNHGGGGKSASSAAGSPLERYAPNGAKGASGSGDASSVASALKDSSGAGSLTAPGAGAPAAAAAPAQSAQPAQLPDVLGHKIVQTSDIDVQVKEVSRSFQDIVRIATAAGGFVAGSTFSNADDKQIADLTIRVPTDQYQNVLAQIRGMGKVATEKSDANDVTQEYTDLQARLRTLQATEQRYLELLAKAETVTDILTLQDRLDSVRGQIEQVQGRIDLLDHLTNLATITIHLRPLAVAQASTDGGAHPIDAAQSAWEHSLDALRGLAAAALVVTVFSWWLIPPLAAFAFGARWWLGRRPRPGAQTT